VFWCRPSIPRPSIPRRPPHRAHSSSGPPSAPRLPRLSAPEPGRARRCVVWAGAGQAPQAGGGERAGRLWREGSSGALHQYRREAHTTQERAEAVIALSTEQGFSFFLAWAMILRGWALAMQGQRDEGITGVSHLLLTAVESYS